MKKFKKLCALALCFALCVMLFGCVSQDQGESDAADGSDNAITDGNDESAVAYPEDTVEPRIIYVPWKMGPGEVGSVFGGYFGTNVPAAEVALQPLTGFTGGLSPESAAYKLKPFSMCDELAQFEIPADLPFDVFAIWVRNSLTAS